MDYFQTDNCWSLAIVTHNKEARILQPESIAHSFDKHILNNYRTGTTMLGGRDVTAYRTPGHQYQASTRWQQDPQIQPVLRTSALTHGLVRNAVRQTLITWEKNTYRDVHSYSNEEKMNNLWTGIGDTEGFLHENTFFFFWKNKQFQDALGALPIWVW